MVFTFFQWVESTRLHDVLANSPWMFAVIESIHLLGLSVIGGAVLMLDLRFLGYGLKSQSIQEVAKEMQPWLVRSLIVMLVTGVLLFISEPTKCYYSLPFWWKMASLALATLFTFTIRRKAWQADEARVRPLYYKLVALVSLTLWFGVGAGGRWIGFSG
jgi:uncharacterized membrane protein YhdT